MLLKRNKTVVINGKEIIPGTILKRPLFLGCNHLGVYVGNNKVINYHITGKNAHIIEEDIEDFADGLTITIHLSPKDEAHAKKIVDTARRIMNNKKWDTTSHKWFSFNCEDFVKRCWAPEKYPLDQRGKIAICLSTILLAITASSLHLARKKGKNV